MQTMARGTLALLASGGMWGPPGRDPGVFRTLVRRMSGAGVARALCIGPEQKRDVLVVDQPTASSRDRDSRPWTVPSWRPRGGAEMTHAVPYDSASFDAGQDCGTRIAACIARLSALELIDGSRWWNRRGRRRIAAALVTYAEALESDADAHARCGRQRLTGPRAVLRDADHVAPLPRARPSAGGDEPSVWRRTHADPRR